jgi:hypothetical protein
MAVYGGPDIVTDGLVLCLDAGNSKSYPGSGATWFDISGQNNHLYWTSPAPTLTTHQGVPVIDTSNISSSLRSVMSTTYNGFRTSTQTYSVCSFFRPNALTINKILFSFGPANNNCSGQNIHPIAINAQGRFGGGSCGALGTWNTAGGQTPSTSQFWYVCSTYDGITEKIYVNGSLDKSASMSSSTPVSTDNKISLGWIRNDGASYTMSASISNISVYTNKVLSLNEIQQNYNAIKGRFGL